MTPAGQSGGGSIGLDRVPHGQHHLSPRPEFQILFHESLRFSESIIKRRRIRLSQTAGRACWIQPHWSELGTVPCYRAGKVLGTCTPYRHSTPFETVEKSPAAVSLPSPNVKVPQDAPVATRSVPLYSFQPSWITKYRSCYLRALWHWRTVSPVLDAAASELL